MLGADCLGKMPLCSFALTALLLIMDANQHLLTKMLRNQ